MTAFPSFQAQISLLGSGKKQTSLRSGRNSWGDLASSWDEENKYFLYEKEQQEKVLPTRWACTNRGGGEPHNQKKKLKDRTHQQSHFILRWGAVDPAAAPAGRPEAQESGSTAHYRAHCFSPVRREHSWDMLTSEPLLLLATSVLCYFLLLKACRIPSFLSWVREAPTPVPGSAGVLVPVGWERSTWGCCSLLPRPRWVM